MDRGRQGGMGLSVCLSVYRSAYLSAGQGQPHIQHTAVTEGEWKPVRTTGTVGVIAFGIRF